MFTTSPVQCQLDGILSDRSSGAASVAKSRIWYWHNRDRGLLASAKAVNRTGAEDDKFRQLVQLADEVASYRRCWREQAYAHPEPLHLVHGNVIKCMEDVQCVAVTVLSQMSGGSRRISGLYCSAGLRRLQVVTVLRGQPSSCCIRRFTWL